MPHLAPAPCSHTAAAPSEFPNEFLHISCRTHDLAQRSVPISERQATLWPLPADSLKGAGPRSGRRRCIDRPVGCVRMQVLRIFRRTLNSASGFSNCVTELDCWGFLQCLREFFRRFHRHHPRVRRFGRLLPVASPSWLPLDVERISPQFRAAYSRTADRGSPCSLPSRPDCKLRRSV